MPRVAVALAVLAVREPVLSRAAKGLEPPLLAQEEPGGEEPNHPLITPKVPPEDLSPPAGAFDPPAFACAAPPGLFCAATGAGGVRPIAAITRCLPAAAFLRSAGGSVSIHSELE